MKITLIPFCRMLLLLAFLTSCVYATYGTEDHSLVRIIRNAAWNDLITQIDFLPDDVPQDSFEKEMIVIQKFLKAHEKEIRLEVYDIEVLRAIDQARARLQRADKDLEVVRNELSYREVQAKLGR